MSDATEVRRRWIGMKILTASAVLQLLSFGLCSVAHTDGWSRLGMLGVWVSVYGLLLGLVVALVEAVVARVRRSKRSGARATQDERIH